MKKERIFYFDLLRVVAYAAVIIIHLASKYIIEESLPTFNFWTSDVINSLVRYAVPIFVMLSGALFFG